MLSAEVLIAVLECERLYFVSSTTLLKHVVTINFHVFSSETKTSYNCEESLNLLKDRLP